MKQIIFYSMLCTGLLFTSLSSAEELSALQNKKTIQGYIRKFTTAFKTLSPTTLRNIISKQTIAFQKNFNTFMTQKTTSNALRVIANAAAITAAISVLTGEAAAVIGASYLAGKGASKIITEENFKKVFPTEVSQ